MDSPRLDAGLQTRLSTALAMMEVAYVGAKRRCGLKASRRRCGIQELPPPSIGPVLADASSPRVLRRRGPGNCSGSLLKKEGATTFRLSRGLGGPGPESACRAHPADFTTANKIQGPELLHPDPVTTTRADWMGVSYPRGRWKERSSVTDRRDKGRESEDDQHRREEMEREQRAGELREAWRRRHPTEEERDKDSWPKKGSPA